MERRKEGKKKRRKEGKKERRKEGKKENDSARWPDDVLAQLHLAEAIALVAWEQLRDRRVERK